MPLRFFLSGGADQTIEETLAVRRTTIPWISPSLETFHFPAIDLPTDDPQRIFRLWGLTLGMTDDLIELAGNTGSRPVLRGTGLL